jgi:hypothetical protein
LKASSSSSVVSFAMVAFLSVQRPGRVELF